MRPPATQDSPFVAASCRCAACNTVQKNGQWQRAMRMLALREDSRSNRVSRMTLDGAKTRGESYLSAESVAPELGQDASSVAIERT